MAYSTALVRAEGRNSLCFSGGESKLWPVNLWYKVKGVDETQCRVLPPLPTLPPSWQRMPFLNVSIKRDNTINIFRAYFFFFYCHKRVQMCVNTCLQMDKKTMQGTKVNINGLLNGLKITSGVVNVWLKRSKWGKQFEFSQVWLLWVDMVDCSNIIHTLALLLWIYLTYSLNE